MGRKAKLPWYHPYEFLRIRSLRLSTSCNALTAAHPTDIPAFELRLREVLSWKCADRVSAAPALCAAGMTITLSHHCLLEYEVFSHYTGKEPGGQEVFHEICNISLENLHFFADIQHIL
jgi:hypothetical protein